MDKDGNKVGETIETFVCHKTLFPKWGEQQAILYVLSFSLFLTVVYRPVVAGARKLHLKVSDYDGPVKADFMGEAECKIAVMPQKVYVAPRYFQLKCKTKEFAAIKV